MVCSTRRPGSSGLLFGPRSSIRRCRASGMRTVSRGSPPDSRTPGIRLFGIPGVSPCPKEVEEIRPSVANASCPDVSRETSLRAASLTRAAWIRGCCASEGVLQGKHGPLTAAPVWTDCGVMFHVKHGPEMRRTRGCLSQSPDLTRFVRTSRLVRRHPDALSAAVPAHVSRETSRPRAPEMRSSSRGGDPSREEVEVVRDVAVGVLSVVERELHRASRGNSMLIHSASCAIRSSGKRASPTRRVQGRGEGRAVVPGE